MVIKFELLTEILHIVERILDDDTTKHLVEASEHIETAGEEIIEASWLVWDLMQNIKSGGKTRDMLTAEVIGMLPEHLQKK